MEHIADGTVDANGYHPLLTTAALTEQEAIRMMRTMDAACDALWLVDPSTFVAQEVDTTSEKLGEPFCCYTALEKDRRCENCIAAIAVSEKTSATKFEFDEAEDAFFMSARYVEVDGRPCAVEMIQRVNDSIGLHEGGVHDFARRIHEATDAECLDELTGAFNRHYFDEGFSGLTECKFAMLRVENLGDIEDAHGFAASNALVKAVHDAVRAHIRHVDTLIRYEHDTFALQFEDLADDEFATKVEEICEAANAARTADWPELIPDVIVGAVDEEGLLSRLADEVERLLAHAERTGRHVVLYSDHLDHHHSALRDAGAEEIVTHDLIDSTDELTGLLAPIKFREVLQQVIEEATPTDAAHADEPTGWHVVHLDIEDFKSYNRHHGFSGGDAVLMEVADAVRREFVGDAATRLPVDRFLILTRTDDIPERVSRIHRAIRDHSGQVSLELKAGVYDLTGEVREAATAMDRAKLACESIKGRYDIICRDYDDEFDHFLSSSQFVLKNIDHALADGLIKVFYQPVIRAATGNVCGFEALARWDDPVHGLLSPAIFIPTLERTHLIHKIDAYVINDVCRLLSTLRSEGQTAWPVSVNLSRVDFQVCDVYEMVEGIVSRWGVPPELVAVEVTESALEENPYFFREQLDRFRAAGHEVWVDDFGSGYSSLNLLKDYNFDLLKIDMGFLRGFESNQRAREIIATVVDMAKRLGVRTLVEGVETPAQHAFLRRIGCEILQGYLFDQPWAFDDPKRNHNLAFEDLEERAYFNAVGSVNLLGPTPDDEDLFAFTTDSEQRTVPLAVIEYRGGRLGYLAANEAYLKLVESVHPDYLDEAHEMLNAGASTLLEPLRTLVIKHLADDRDETIVCTLGNVEHEMRIHHIASTGEVAHAFLVSVDERE